MELVLNNEHNGIELYFGEKPNKNIIDMLKVNKFRWHSVKKCWFAKNTDKNMLVANNIKAGKIEIIENKKTVVENELGIKVGDIFYMSWGYEQTNVDFFRVKALRGKTQVILQEVSLNITEEKGISGMSCDRKYGKDYSLVKNSCFVNDNEKGIVKKVQGTKERPFIDMTSYANAYKYDGRELYESWYY